VKSDNLKKNIIDTARKEKCFYTLSKFFAVELHSRVEKPTLKKNDSIFNLWKWDYTLQSKTHSKNFRENICIYSKANIIDSVNDMTIATVMSY